MSSFAPTIRERQVFAALMDQILEQMPKGNDNFPTAHTHLKKGLDRIKSRTARMEKEEAEINKLMAEEIAITDYRE